MRLVLKRSVSIAIVAAVTALATAPAMAACNGVQADMEIYAHGVNPDSISPVPGEVVTLQNMDSVAQVIDWGAGLTDTLAPGECMSLTYYGRLGFVSQTNPAIFGTINNPNY